jgi:hypothetical protein
MSDSNDRMAAKIAALLAQAEGEAKAGNEAARDVFLEKAAALQLKYAIEDAMLRRDHGVGSEEIVHADFCRESNTPLIKAKRELIAGLAELYRGRAILMPEWQPRKDGKGLKLNRRAYVRVYAHESDLRFINQLYTSLILQMQTMMAADERRHTEIWRSNLPAWRVSYAYGWVGRVCARLREAGQRNEAAAETGAPGTALVLRDRTALVNDHVTASIGKTGKAKYRRDDNDVAGRRAGRAAAEQADLGGKKVQGTQTRQLNS